jgi:hypothetical protein
VHFRLVALALALASATGCGLLFSYDGYEKGSAASGAHGGTTDAGIDGVVNGGTWSGTGNVGNGGGAAGASGGSAGASGGSAGASDAGCTKPEDCGAIADCWDCDAGVCTPRVGNVCGSSCDKGAQTIFKCTSAGTCIADSPTQCDAYQCDPATSSCRTTCVNSADCAVGYYCQATTCTSCTLCITELFNPSVAPNWCPGDSATQFDNLTQECCANCSFDCSDTFCQIPQLTPNAACLICLKACSPYIGCFNDVAE